jgi:hypothetical protein
MLSMLIFSFLIHADQAPKAPADFPSFEPKFTCFKQDVPKCEDIESRLIEYNNNITAHANSFVEFTSTLRDAIQSWYDDQFSPLQTGEKTLNDSYFDFIPPNIAKVDEAATFAALTRNCMKDELDKIIKAMQNPDCKKAH